MMFILHRLQARFRGLIVRTRVKSAMVVQRGFQGRDNYGKYHFVQNSQIVKKFKIFFL